MKQMFLGNLTMTVKWPPSILDLSNHQRPLLLPIRLGTSDSKRSLYNDQLPVPTEAENTACRGLGLSQREEEPQEPRGHRTASVLFYQVLTHHIWEEEAQWLWQPSTSQRPSGKVNESDLRSMQEDLFGNRGRQGWAPDWSIGLRSLQKIPSGSQDRRILSNPQHFSVSNGDLYWNGTPYP